MKGLTRQIVLGAAVVLTLVMNTLAGTGHLFGRATGSISDNLPNTFTPAGLTFSIWGVIFLGLIAFALWQGRFEERGPRLDSIGWPFLLANLSNILWLLAWHSLSYGLSVVVMLCLLGSLIWLYLRLDGLKLGGPEKLWLGVPTSLYLGWISVATIANVTAWLVSVGDRNSLWGIGAQTWAALLIGAATLIGAFLLERKRDWVFGAVLAWSFYGVYLARPGAAVLAVVIVAAVAALVLAYLGGLRRLRYAI